MDGRPGARDVPCPECGETSPAIVPRKSRIVEDEENADGKVRVICLHCRERFHACYELE